jgi:hypothetical protein
MVAPVHCCPIQVLEPKNERSLDMLSIGGFTHLHKVSRLAKLALYY